MNLNPSLLMGLVLAWLEKRLPDLRDYDRQQITLRVYDAEGAGFHFIRAHAPGRWYYDDDPSDGHWSNCDLADVEAAIASGARVQITGVRGQSYGVWHKWEQFAREVLDAGV